MSRLTIAVVSDLHCGSTVGLHPHEPTSLDNGALYVPSEAQLWMADRWEHYWNRVADVAGAGPLHVIVNGDLVDGDHHGTVEIVSRHPNTQMDIAKACFQRVLALNPSSVAVVRGTEVHVGKSGSAEESFGKWLVAQGITVPKEQGTGNASHWHYQGIYGGVLVDAAHHGRIGSRPWTKVNATMGLAAQIVMEHAVRKERAPDLAIRSHYHQWVDTYDAFPTRVVQTPAWQLKTAYVHKVAAESLAEVGGAIVTIEDGEVLQIEKVVYPVARPTPQVIG